MIFLVVMNKFWKASESLMLFGAFLKTNATFNIEQRKHKRSQKGEKGLKDLEKGRGTVFRLSRVHNLAKFPSLVFKTRFFFVFSPFSHRFPSFLALSSRSSSFFMFNAFLVF